MKIFRFITVVIAAWFLSAVSSFAVETVAVKDRCGNTTVLKSLALLLDDRFPSKSAEKAAFYINPNTLFTVAYDENVDKVSCRADMTLILDLVTDKKMSQLAKKAGIPTLEMNVYFFMQYSSGNNTNFDVNIIKLERRNDGK